MTKVKEERLLSTLKSVFDRLENNFLEEGKLRLLLVQEDLTDEEVRRSISLALRKKIIRFCRTSPTGKGKSVLCYQLLTEEDRDFDRELEEQS